MTCIHERNNALRCSTIWWHNNAALISSIGQQCEFNVGNCTKHWIAPRQQQHWFSCCFHLKSRWYFDSMLLLVNNKARNVCLWFLNSTFPFTVHSLVLTHTLRMIGREKSNFPLALARLFRPQLKLQLPYVFRTPTRVCSKVKRHYSKSYSCFMGVV